ncbi:MAG: hypothetical protein N2049_06905 [Anaerolineales bacterium]|nr:hypothetical protein [Anaerolineales bacterium]
MKSKILSYSFWMPYLLFLLVIGATYGVYLSRWGFYYDDWPEVYLYHNRLNLFEYYQFDRPVLSLTVWLLSKLAGTSPLAWHVLASFLRWALVSAFYWCFSLLWPNNKFVVMIGALLFAVYPAYSLQPIALTFSKVYLLYTVYFLSLGFMIKSLQASTRSWLFAVISLVTMLYHTVSLEYFWGLELARPAVIWLVLADHSRSSKERFILTFRNTLPYTGVLVVLILYRIGFASFRLDHFYFTAERNNPIAFLQAVFSSPQNLFDYLRMIMRDIKYVLWDSWSKKSFVDIGIKTQIRFVLLTLASLVAIFFFAFRIFRLRSDQNLLASEKQNEFFWLGLLMLILGMTPVWSVGNSASTPGPFDNRHAFAAISGMSLLLAGLLGSLRSALYRGTGFAFLMILAVSYQLYNGYDYYKDWKRQRSFFWQLYWRVPSLPPGTFLLTDKPPFPYLTSNDVHLGPAVAVLYQLRDGNYPSQWAFSLDALLEDYHVSPEEPKSGVEIYRAVRTLEFRALSTRALSIDYSPDRQGCLWVLTPDDIDYPYWSEREKLLVTLSSPDVILPEATSAPEPNIFGPEPPHTWCYYFQKASLARQQSDWETVVALGEEALERRLYPDDVYEWLPFLEGYIRTGEWERAATVTEEIITINPDYRQAVCNLWRRATEMKQHPDDVSDLLPTITCKP